MANKYSVYLKDPSKIAQLTKEQTLELLDTASNLLENKPLLRITTNKFLVVGDIHGDFDALKEYISQFMSGKFENIIFLGDYIDRGKKQLECICILLVLKILYLGKVILLRGNHETTLVNSRFGFKEVVNDNLLYKKFNLLFMKMPIAIVVKISNNTTILCAHGGISERIAKLEELEKNYVVDEYEPLFWNDPAWDENVKGFISNNRGTKDFGKDIFLKFMQANNLKLLVRSHQVTPKIAKQGYDVCFDDKLLSIFSCSEYSGQEVNRIIAKVNNNDIKINDKIILKIDQ
ncbi:TPA: hypothetical protein HA246_00210 [Candidatus Woesearchaeota archaeon]|nr:hypothetical protein [Candidatus Woesearchaeota archaeon]